MHIGLISSSGDGKWIAWLLEKEGHSVHYYLSDERYAGIMDGIGPPASTSIDNPEAYDLIVFDLTGFNKVADYARTLTPVIGDSSFADKLEFDRVFALDFMEHSGIAVPKWEAFDNPSDGLKFIRKMQKRMVFKPCGPADCASTYVSKSPDDMARYFDVLFRKTHVKEFVLQEFVEGTEISTEVWINENGYYVPNHTIELKKFLSGDLGPNTGCGASVVWIPNRETPLFEMGIKKAIPALQDEGYVGCIDLNAIVTHGELYGLEFTPRFGYDATANLTRLLPLPFGEFLYRIATGERVDNIIPKHQFAATIRLSIPPYPNEHLPKKSFQEGVPIDGLTPQDLDTFYAADIRLVPDSDELETAGTSGFIGCPIGVGHSISEAFDEVMTSIKRLRIPDLMYRNDAKEKCVARYSMLEKDAWLR